MNSQLQKKIKLLEYLSGFITDNKKQKIEKIIVNRTKYLTLVLEDIFQPHNASAVLRSCDCFGIQDIHIIENRNKYNVNPDIALGSSKWVNIIKYNAKSNNTEECMKSLKNMGYTLIATLPDEKYKTIEELELDKKTAIMFGTEMNGLSATALKHADDCVRINMFGFTESLNISVSAAICIHYLTSKLRSSSVNWQLTKEEIVDTKLYWVKNIVKSSALLEKEFNKQVTDSN